ncbi:hypothetical protein CVIRNUC_003185 [Coccomyxa viridis]|uniref:beta-mannosidase n=1 Tax=Coccomyxa viridis TaxID=1274662 RepID=A0AAV1I0K2_9CHLO|nr:hypothetical protein CVIRNUC_003185 [Coccomyxa viridis]
MMAVRTALIAVLAIAGVARVCNAQSTSLPLVTDLAGAGWTVQNTNGSIKLDTSIPGYALEALVNAGQAPNPLARYNELLLRWTTAETWTFERQFNVSASTLAQRNVDLVMTGVDTIAAIYVDGVSVANTTSIHLQYRIPIKAALNGTAGAHMLKVVISPAEATANLRAAEYGYGVPGLTQPGGLAYYNFIRKPASDFGWDWGPAFTPAGIYGMTEIQAYSNAIMTAAVVRQEHNSNGSVTLSFDAYLNAPVAGEVGTLAIAVQDGSGPWNATQNVSLPTTGENKATVQILVDANTFELWWPVGYGGQTLYPFAIAYTPSAGNATANSTLYRSVGFRTMELVREPRTETFTLEVQLESFYFRVNGVPIFARGSNAVPVDIFHSKSTVSAVKGLVSAAIDANMNMIRVWGGGMYYRDEFYDACDQAGLLVWQEAMFACSLYPANKAFLDDVRAEVTYQARRLDSHPSLAIWGGGNEVEASFRWFPDSRDDPQSFTDDYMQVFVHTIRTALMQVDPEVPFVDSSPSNQIKTLDPYSKRWGIDASDPRWGDGHYYDYTGDCLDTRVYPRSKFVSEFGFQSYPSFGALKNVTVPEDWSYTSAMMNYRNRKDNGNPTMVAQIARHFNLPDSKATSSNLQADLFQQFIYLTQVVQSRCYEAATAYWRRIKTDPDAETMGVLYWQLNDIWQAPSWSSTDYGGHWKLLHYAAKRFFSPLLISADYNKVSNIVSVYLTSDINQALRVNVTAQLVAWNATQAPAVSHDSVYTIAPLGSKQFLSFDFKDSLAEAGASAGDISKYFVHLTATSTVPNTSQGTVSTKSLGSAGVSYTTTWDVFPVELKNATLPTAPAVRMANFTNGTEPGTATFVVSSQGIAAYVALETTILGKFSDNAFLLLPWEPKTVTFTSGSNFTVDQLESSMTVMSVADTMPGARNTKPMDTPPMDEFSIQTSDWVQELWVPAYPPVDPLAITKAAGISPRVSSCGGSPDPCAPYNTTTA